MPAPPRRELDAPTQDQLRRRSKPLGSRVPLGSPLAAEWAGWTGQAASLAARAQCRGGSRSALLLPQLNRGRPQTHGIAGHHGCMHSAALAALRVPYCSSDPSIQLRSQWRSPCALRASARPNQLVVCLVQRMDHCRAKRRGDGAPPGLRVPKRGVSARRAASSVGPPGAPRPP